MVHVEGGGVFPLALLPELLRELRAGAAKVEGLVSSPWVVVVW